MQTNGVDGLALVRELTCVQERVLFVSKGMYRIKFTANCSKNQRLERCHFAISSTFNQPWSKHSSLFSRHLSQLRGLIVQTDAKGTVPVASMTSALATCVPMEILHGPHTIVPRGHALMDLHGRLKRPTVRTTLILTPSALTKELATATVENVSASRTTMERLANVPCAPTIALDVESA
mmetsp:Transcript_20704/g.44764  ORF Transcript_20704/g.44764 Transcript_20704/m.44764 type:complete len:179 (-) Transcript_20704:386-922(-)